MSTDLSQDHRATGAAQTPADVYAELQPVELGAIEKELDTLWRQNNVNNAAVGGHAFSRNSVLSLVVYTYSQRQAIRILDAIHALTSQHPSRAIVVIADPANTGTSVQARIGAFVGPNGGSYGEDIVLEAQNEATQHLPGVVLPLIVSGLPSFVWWTGEPPWGSELLEALVDGSDRFIVDTAEVTYVERSLAALADLLRRKKTRTAITDMTWSAQAPWREIVAGFFDSEQLRPYLDGIDRIGIEYAAGPDNVRSNSSQAYLFAGWLASRLGWSAGQALRHEQDDGHVHTLRAPGGRAVSVEITPRYGVSQRSWWDQDSSSDARPAVRHGALMSAHITSRLNGDRATFSVAREHDLEHATTYCQAPQGALPSQTLHLQSLGEGDLLAEQFQMLGHDSVFEDAVLAAARLVGVEQRRGSMGK